MPLLNKLATFARSPQGRRMTRQAMQYAKSPQGKAKIAQLRQTVGSKRGGPRPQ